MQVPPPQRALSWAPTPPPHSFAVGLQSVHEPLIFFFNLKAFAGAVGRFSWSLFGLLSLCVPLSTFDTRTCVIENLCDRVVLSLYSKFKKYFFL